MCIFQRQISTIFRRRCPRPHTGEEARPLPLIRPRAEDSFRPGSYHAHKVQLSTVLQGNDLRKTYLVLSRSVRLHCRGSWHLGTQQLGSQLDCSRTHSTHKTLSCDNCCLVPDVVSVSTSGLKKPSSAPVTRLFILSAVSLCCTWWSGVVVSALASINEVNLHRTWLVMRWETVSGFNSRCLTLISVFDQPTSKANSAFHPSRGR